MAEVLTLRAMLPIHKRHEDACKKPHAALFCMLPLPALYLQPRLVLSCRDNARAEFVTSLGLGGKILYNPGAQRATLEVDDWGPAAMLNSVLWRVYPEANLLEGENIAGALQFWLFSLSIAYMAKGFNAAAGSVMTVAGRLMRLAYVCNADALRQCTPCSMSR